MSTVKPNFDAGVQLQSVQSIIKLMYNKRKFSVCVSGTLTTLLEVEPKWCNKDFMMRI